MYQGLGAEIPTFAHVPQVYYNGKKMSKRDTPKLTADEIAKFMFGDVKHRRKVYYLTGEAPRGMPHFKIGSVICARKSTLLNWIAQQERFTPGE